MWQLMMFSLRTRDSVAGNERCTHSLFRNSYAMAQRAIREVDGKRLLSQWLPEAWATEAINADVTPLLGIQTRKAFTVSGSPPNWAELAAACVFVDFPRFPA